MKHLTLATQLRWSWRNSLKRKERRAGATPRIRCLPLRMLQPTAVVLLCMLPGIPKLHPEESKHSEYEVKAAYLYNFGSFVEWPIQSPVTKRAVFTICVLGQDPFGPILDATLAGESIAGKAVVPKRIAKPQDATDCQILFISSSEENGLKEIVAALAKTSVLTVSDISQFARRGGMVQFVLEGTRVRFEVNLTAAARVGLSLSSELLKIAVNTRRAAP